ncbi:type II CAAX endopeptidase family protein [Rhodanobacter sp. L36]|uniref:CPBP family intramembrane glutamic endopeptidase n=1 Tax=Rhodanobacter sp. L36 TaxID=1747221 RepID=UPI00131B883F|nr:type II CAAX endopeptidase family protein [Rhodanobacter sp. L36]
MTAGFRRKVFFDGRDLRIGWGIALFIAIVVSLRFVQYFGFTRQLPDHWLQTPQGLLIEEAIRAAIVLFATFVLARIERRAFDSYGLGGSDRLRLLLKGSLWGFAALSVVLAMQWLGGNIALSRSADDALRLIGNGALWLATFYAVAVFEELLLRGYLQTTLARGIGFWWSALVWSAVFVWMHTSNPGESLLGLAQTGWIALFFCLALRLTGSLWWVIGYHALWDWGESYFYGVPNSGQLFDGRLMTANASGNPLWSGGTGGPEASLWSLFVLVLPIIALCWQYRHGSTKERAAQSFDRS